MKIVRAEDLEPGDRIDNKYEVRAVLGVGGMGIVVEAIHLDLQERVALKFLLSQPRDHEDITARFLREARTVRKLKSEHIVKVIDVGRRADSGEPYIAMELLEGRDLSAELAEVGPLPIETACGFVVQACDALAEAHASRIVHRDIKPANLFLTYPRGGTRACVKVLDFGIAKVIEGDGKGTQTKAMMGSALYMSPEQMRSSKTVDARTDIWALGVTLYELLTGHTPFSADSIPELILAITSEPPTPPRTYRPELPAALEALLLRCLEKNVDARLPTVAALAVELAAFTDDESARLARAIEARRASFDDTLNQPRPREDVASTLPLPAPSPHASTALGLTITNASAVPPDRRGRRIAVATLLLGASVLSLGLLFQGRASTARLADNPDASVQRASAAPGAVATAAPTEPLAAPQAVITLVPDTPASGALGALGSAPASSAITPAKTVPRAVRPTPLSGKATALPPKTGQLGTSVD